MHTAWTISENDSFFTDLLCRWLAISQIHNDILLHKEGVFPFLWIYNFKKGKVDVNIPTCPFITRWRCIRRWITCHLNRQWKAWETKRGEIVQDWKLFFKFFKATNKLTDDEGFSAHSAFPPSQEPHKSCHSVSISQIRRWLGHWPWASLIVWLSSGTSSTWPIRTLYIACCTITSFGTCLHKIGSCWHPGTSTNWFMLILGGSIPAGVLWDSGPLPTPQLSYLLSSSAVIYLLDKWAQWNGWGHGRTPVAFCLLGMCRCP